MALIPCPEPDCGRQISSFATNCPHCGCPVAAVPQPATAAGASSPAATAPPPAEILRVALDGSAPFQSLQRALAAVTKTDTLIRIAPGTYREELRTNFENLRVTLEAEEAVGSVILQPEKPFELFARSIGIEHKEGELDLRGFSLNSDVCRASNGHMTFQDCRIHSILICDGQSQVKIENCDVNCDANKIELCERAHLKMNGGIFRGCMEVRGDACAALTKVVVKCNGLGLRCYDHATLHLVSSTVEANGQAAAIELEGRTSRIERSQIIASMVAFGVYLRGSHVASISDTKISGCGIGLIVSGDSRCMVTNCDLQGNEKPVSILQNGRLEESNNSF